MSKNIKLSIALVAAFVAAIAVALVVTAGPGEVEAADVESVVVRDDSNRLSVAPDGKVTLVEFLDLECEACGAVYPFVEELRETYADRVTFVARYFPIPSHANAMNAAISVQAAANQGQFEAMYQRMYETQTEWAEQQDSQAAVFRTYAEGLGLDMTQYDADVADPATQARVEKDREDGTALGVEGTPTFFLNGKKIEPQTTEEFTELIDQALAS